MTGRYALLIASALVLGGVSVRAGEPATPGAALSEDDCRAIWNVAAGRSDLGPEGAKPYIDSFPSVDANRDNKISNAEFKAGCAAGLVHKFRAPE